MRVTRIAWVLQYFWMPLALWRTPMPDSPTPPNGSSCAA
jgi:hypothetical protein